MVLLVTRGTRLVSVIEHILLDNLSSLVVWIMHDNLFSVRIAPPGKK